MCLEREQWWKSAGFSKLGMAMAPQSSPFIMGHNSAVLLLSVCIDDVQAACEGENCSSLLPLRKKYLRGERKLQKELYLNHQGWS